MSKIDTVPISRSEARRSKILDVAWMVFIDQGFGGASMSDIAERLGGSKGTLYNYFPSKEELFLAAAKRKGEELRGKLTGVFRQSDILTDDLKSDLTHLACRLLDIVRSPEHMACFRVMIAEAVRIPVIGELAYEQRALTLLASLAARIKMEIEAGRLRQVDPMEAAEVFWDLCSASINWRSLLALTPDLSTKDIKRLVERGVLVFLSAYAVPLQAAHRSVSKTPSAKNDR